MSGSTSNITNSLGQSIDTIWAADGSKRIKLAVGVVDVGGDTEDGSWQGVASHEEGATFATGDGVSVAGGVDGSSVVHPATADDSGRLVVVSVPTQGSLTDRSGSITSGGTQQTLAASNLARKYLMVQNQDGTEDLWINFGTNAVADQPSIRIVAKDIFKMEGSFVSTQSVSVIAATTGHKFTAKEG